MHVTVSHNTIVLLINYSHHPGQREKNEWLHMGTEVHACCWRLMEGVPSSSETSEVATWKDGSVQA